MAYPRQLKLEMQQRQLQDIFGNNVIYSGPNPLSLVQSQGTLTNPWVDFTDFVQNLDKLTLIWSTSQTPQGQVPEGEFLPRRGSSTQLTFERAAYDFLKTILVDNVAAPLNQISVRVTDIANGAYIGYVIKSTDLSWCEFNSICTYETSIKQQDEWTQCVQRTLIADPWQGWFNPEPTQYAANSTMPVPKYHPRFSYCTEHRPNGTIVIMWYILGFIGFMATIVFGGTLLYNGLMFLINFIIAIINSIVSAVNTLGGSLSTVSPEPYIDPTSVFSGYAQLYIESAGCGREHPAPLIRDYITNVCTKCGINVDSTTADIFFAPILTVQKSDGITYNEPNPHYNACLFYPQVKRGIRRYSSINLFGPSTLNTTTFYEPLNQPVWALSDMLDHLKKLYNAQWTITSDAAGVPSLYFKRKDFFTNEPPLYDFSVGGADRSKLLEGICYQPTEFTAPASMNGLYQDDPADKCGHENSRFMNGDPLSFNNTINNPLFFGVLDKTSGFGAPKFRLDGSTSDYIYDAGQVVLNGSLLVPSIAGQMDTVFCFVRKYCDYAILLQGETTSLPKVIIWDGMDNNTAPCDNSNAGNPYLNARAMRDKVNIAGTVYTIGKTAYAGTVGSLPMPDINTKYPQQVTPDPTSIPTLIAPATIPEPLAWNFVGRITPTSVVIASYPPETAVIGHSLTPGSPDGKYTVQNYVGSVISTQPAILVNYPMYFQPYYKDSLWDWFHWIDDPYSNPKLHKNWNLKIPLCAEDIVKLGITSKNGIILGDGSAIKLLRNVILDSAFYFQGVITDIEVCYDTGDSDTATAGTGQYIQLKGIV